MYLSYGGMAAMSMCHINPFKSHHHTPHGSLSNMWPSPLPGFPSYSKVHICAFTVPSPFHICFLLFCQMLFFFSFLEFMTCSSLAWQQTTMSIGEWGSDELTTTTLSIVYRLAWSCVVPLHPCLWINIRVEPNPIHSCNHMAMSTRAYHKHVCPCLCSEATMPNLRSALRK